MNPKKLLYLYSLTPAVLYIIPIFNISRIYEEIFAMITIHLITVVAVTKIFINFNNKKWKIEFTKNNVWKYSLINTTIALIIGQGLLFGVAYILHECCMPHF